jgi:hypothetical protein
VVINTHQGGGKIRGEIKDINLREKLEEDQKNRKNKNSKGFPDSFLILTQHKKKPLVLEKPSSNV